VVIGPLKPAGLSLDVGLDPRIPDVPELPEWLDFLTAADPDKLVLAAVSERGFESHGEHPFYYLSRLTNAITHYFPFVPHRHFQHSLTVGEETSVSPEDALVSTRTVSYEPARHSAVFELTVVNTRSDPIMGLEAYFFNTPVRAVPNAHGHAQFSSRVNRVGPVPGFRFGDLAVGDAVTRRVHYDTSFSTTVGVGWTPRLVPFADDGGFGNGCTTSKPEPIPDNGPTPALAAGCFDAGCGIGGDCPGGQHQCGTASGACGCDPVPG
jgi:hypothetical protein